MKSRIRIVSEAGSGRTFVVIVEKGSYKQLAEAVSERLSRARRTLLIEIDQVTDSNWQELTTELLQVIRESKVRQCSMIGFGASCTLVLNSCLVNRALIRTAAVVDAATRPHPSQLAKIVDTIEEKLPLGLPLRSRTAGFDAKPFLQRIRCPILIVKSSKAAPYIKSQAELLGSSLPVSWGVSLSEKNEAEELSSLVSEFQDVPAKRPQKNASK